MVGWLSRRVRCGWRRTSRVVSNSAAWNKVLGFGGLFIPVTVLITFDMAGDSVSVGALAAILGACCALGVVAGVLYNRVGKSHSRAAAWSAAGGALALVAAFDGPLFSVVLGAAAVAGCSLIVTDGILELRHRHCSQSEAAS
jgi:hypothetical protein